MRAVYIDTEFTQLSADRCLISLALVDSMGNEFYAELIDGCPFQSPTCSRMAMGIFSTGFSRALSLSLYLEQALALL